MNNYLNPTLNLYVSRLHENAKLPTKGSKLAAGYDLYSCEDITIGPWSKKLVSTGLGMTVPLGTYRRIAPRSGLALKKSIDVLAGVIDHDYEGEVKIILMNLSDETHEFPKHTRVAQLILEKIQNANVKELVDVTKPVSNEQSRGKGGFGSTGNM